MGNWYMRGEREDGLRWESEIKRYYLSPNKPIQYDVHADGTPRTISGDIRLNKSEMRKVMKEGVYILGLWEWDEKARHNVERVIPLPIHFFTPYIETEVVIRKDRVMVEEDIALPKRSKKKK